MTGKNPDWIICFGDHWGKYTMGSPGNIMYEFHRRGKKILWINPIPKTNLTLSKVHGKKGVLIKRIISKLITHIKFFNRHKKRFYILTPIYFPFVESNTGQKFNKVLYKVQIGIVMFLLQVKNYAICNFTSNKIFEFVNLSKSISFFHIAADMHSDLRIANDKQKLELIYNEARLFDLAEKIFPASEQIGAKILSRHGYENKIRLLPHGVESKHFLSPARSDSKLKTFRKPIIGYFGSLTFANDIDIYKAIAAAGFTFVMIGEITADYDELKKYPNVHFFGPVPYSELPYHASYFDVCIMAWKKSEWILNCNPKKTLEYMALGKPIVSITIPYLKDHFGELIYFADEPSDFVKKIHLALKEDSELLRNRRKEIAKSHDWSEVVQTLYNELNWIS